jgi:5-formyltetrahydrofolate cyclo-ligase
LLSHKRACYRWDEVHAHPNVDVGLRELIDNKDTWCSKWLRDGYGRGLIAVDRRGHRLGSGMGATGDRLWYDKRVLISYTILRSYDA